MGKSGIKDSSGQLGQLSLFTSREAQEPEASVAVSPSPPAKQLRAGGDGPKGIRTLALKTALLQRLETPIRSVVLTRNRARILSARPHQNAAGESVGLDIRIHRCFATAPEPVLDAVAQFFEAQTPTARKEPLAVIREHFRRHGQEDTHKPRALRSKGKFFDLEELRDRVNRDYFSSRLDVDIAWSQGPTSKKKKVRSRRRKGAFSIRLGSYDDRFKLVRIHPVLDRRDVPEYVVESIVYHEMLHAVVPPRAGVRRRSVHPPEFRRLERQFARFEEAEAWLEANIERLARLR